MNRVPVESSNIKAVGYDPASQQLEVEFHSGAVHCYHGVPADKHQAMIAAKSVGGYFHANIRGQHKGTKVG